MQQNRIAACRVHDTGSGACKLIQVPDHNVPYCNLCGHTALELVRRPSHHQEILLVDIMHCPTKNDVDDARLGLARAWLPLRVAVSDAVFSNTRALLATKKKEKPIVYHACLCVLLNL